MQIMNELNAWICIDSTNSQTAQKVGSVTEKH